MHATELTLYLNAFAWCLEVFSNHGAHVLLVVIVSANSIVVAGVHLIANVLMKFLHQ